MRERPQDDNITTYQNLVSKECDNELQPVLKPRNLKQVQNIKYLTRKKQKLSHDDYYNLMLVSHELQDYMFEIICFPELSCFFGNKQIMQEFNKLSELVEVEKDMKLYCGYDTTFNLGNFYLTPIVFRHTLFQSDPVIPLGFMIHERKFQFVHERFWEDLVRKIPNLRKGNVPVVVDKEVSITNAIKKVLPEMPILHCWNHIKQDFKFWLGKQQITSDEKLIYMSDLDTIMHSESMEIFETNCNNVTAKWSQPAVRYFEKNVKNNFLKHSAMWVLKQYNLFNPYSGITNNSSEGMNTVIKRLMKWKEAQLDTIVLCLSYLQNYYWNELKEKIVLTYYAQERIAPLSYNIVCYIH